jgi:hypothetical protein
MGLGQAADDFGQVADGRVELGKLRLGLGLVGQELLTMDGEGLRQMLEILLSATLGLDQALEEFLHAALGLGQLGKAAVGFGAELQELLAVGGEGLGQALEGLLCAALGLDQLGEAAVGLGAELQELLAVGGEGLGQALEGFLRAALSLGQLGEAAVGLLSMGQELLAMGNELLTVSDEGLGQALEGLLRVALGLDQALERLLRAALGLDQALEEFLHAALGLDQGADLCAELCEAGVDLGLVGQELLTMVHKGLAQTANGFCQLHEAALGLRLKPGQLVPKIRQLGGHAEDLLRGQEGPEDLPPFGVGLQEGDQIPQVFRRQRHRAPPSTRYCNTKQGFEDGREIRCADRRPHRLRGSLCHPPRLEGGCHLPEEGDLEDRGHVLIGVLEGLGNDPGQRPRPPDRPRHRPGPDLRREGTGQGDGLPADGLQPLQPAGGGDLPGPGEIFIRDLTGKEGALQA